MKLRFEVLLRSVLATFINIRKTLIERLPQVLNEIFTYFTLFKALELVARKITFIAWCFKFIAARALFISF